MELLIKCTAVGFFSSLAALLLKRYHPEISFLLVALPSILAMLRTIGGML